MSYLQQARSLQLWFHPSSLQAVSRLLIPDRYSVPSGLALCSEQMPQKYAVGMPENSYSLVNNGKTQTQIVSIAPIRVYAVPYSMTLCRKFDGIAQQIQNIFCTFKESAK